MNRRLKGFMLATVSLLLLTSHTSFGQTRPERSRQRLPSSRPSLIPVINKQGCLPAEVIGIGQGGFIPEGFEFIVKNYSLKVIRAVKIGWYVLDDQDTSLPTRIVSARCDAPPIPGKIILSGNTQLIQTGALFPEQTCLIGKEPLKFKFEVDNTVLTDFHLMTIDDLKELTTDGTIWTLKKTYSILLAVSEIHFDDGSEWKVEGAPPPLAPAPK